MRDFLGEGLFGWAVGILPRQFNGFQNLEAENSGWWLLGELGRLRDTSTKALSLFIHQFSPQHDYLSTPSPSYLPHLGAYHHLTSSHCSI